MAKSKFPNGKSSPTNSEATTVAPEVAALAPVASGGENGKAKSRPRMVKVTPRPSVVPFSLEEEIRRRAYELYTQRGPSTGGATDDWLVAEREIRERYQEQRA